MRSSALKTRRITRFTGRLKYVRKKGKQGFAPQPNGGTHTRVPPKTIKFLWRDAIPSSFHKDLYRNLRGPFCVVFISRGRNGDPDLVGSLFHSLLHRDLTGFGIYAKR